MRIAGFCFTSVHGYGYVAVSRYADCRNRVSRRSVDVVVDIRAHVGLIESNRSCLVDDRRLQFTVHFTEDRLLRRTSENTDTGTQDNMIEFVRMEPLHGS